MSDTQRADKEQGAMEKMLLNVMRTPHIPLSLRKKIGKVVKFGKDVPFEVQVFEYKYKGKLGIHMDDKIYRYGLHEPATIRLIRHILEKQKSAGRKAVYMDIGTNAGLHLLSAAGVADEAYGFEPWEQVRDRAFVNLAANDLDHVKIFEFGLSDQDAELPFCPPDGNNLGVGMITERGDKDAVHVKVCEGDKIVSQNNIKPSLIKIDVEGHEDSVLRGLKDTIQTYKPDIIFEYSDMSRKTLGTEEARQALFGDDYKFYGILRSREFPKLRPFEPSKKYENVLAVPVSQLPPS